MVLHARCRNRYYERIEKFTPNLTGQHLSHRTAADPRRPDASRTWPAHYSRAPKTRPLTRAGRCPAGLRDVRCSTLSPMPQVAQNGPRSTWWSNRPRTLRARAHVADEHVKQQPTVHESKSFKIAMYDDVGKRSAKVDIEPERQAPSRPSSFCTGTTLRKLAPVRADVITHANASTPPRKGGPRGLKNRDEQQPNNHRMSGTMYSAMYLTIPSMSQTCNFLQAIHGTDRTTHEPPRPH